MYGARTSLLVGIVASGIAVLIGTLIGVLAGFFGGWADTTLSRGADVMLAVPQLLISIGIVAACSTTKEGCLRRADQAGAVDRHRRDRPLHVAVRRARRARKHALAAARRSSSRRAARSAPGNARIIAGESCRTSSRRSSCSRRCSSRRASSSRRRSRTSASAFRPTGLVGQILADASGLYDVAWWLMVFPGVPRLRRSRSTCSATACATRSTCGPTGDDAANSSGSVTSQLMQ